MCKRLKYESVGLSSITAFGGHGSLTIDSKRILHLGNFPGTQPTCHAVQERQRHLVALLPFRQLLSTHRPDLFPERRRCERGVDVVGRGCRWPWADSKWDGHVRVANGARGGRGVFGDCERWGWWGPGARRGGSSRRSDSSGLDHERDRRTLLELVVFLQELGVCKRLALEQEALRFHWHRRKR